MIVTYDNAIVTFSDDMLYHNINGPAIIFIKTIGITGHQFIIKGNYNAGDLLYYVNDVFLGKNLSNKEFERQKHILMKRVVFA